ncbi:MAG: helix-turn-helix transcriptional regulator [Saprospiraceae bacterium]|jgi:DNA-binding HxlR family transcriptional regulator|nr:helix-turn-helix transcriptional regulator [Saprospiraceae bacterium]
MEKKFEVYAKRAECPIRNVLSRLGDKWSMLVLLLLNDGETLRFNQISHVLGDISQKMLTTTLRSLEADGLVNRKMYPEIPPRVEYTLTERGQSLIPVLRQLVDWAVENTEGIKTSRGAMVAQ